MQSLVAHDHDCLHALNVINCNCPQIDFVNKQTYLGVVIDDKFNWSHHVERVYEELRQFPAVMTVLRDRLPFKVKIVQYYAMADSCIQYGLGSCGRAYGAYLDNIYKVQLRILKTIVCSEVRIQFYDDVNGLFKHCGVLPVHLQVTFLLLKERFFNESLRNKIEHSVCTRANSRNRLRAKRQQYVW